MRTEKDEGTRVGGKKITSKAMKKSKIPVLVKKTSSGSEITIYENAAKDGTKRVSSL